MMYVNKCKFGLYVKDLDRIILQGEKFECKNSANIQVLLKEFKIELIKEVQIVKKEIIVPKEEKIELPKKKGNKFNYKKDDSLEKEDLSFEDNFNKEVI